MANNTQRVEKIKTMFSDLFAEIQQHDKEKNIYEFSLKSLGKVQLYLGRLALFFGAGFNGLFETKTLVWDTADSKLTINLVKENITVLQQWYIVTYKKLALHYLNKKDATLFLKDYAIKKDKYFTSTNITIDNFIQYYFNRYKQIGQELDTIDKKENYIL